jgi:bifunctional non-homologous end joining protein LigD
MRRVTGRRARSHNCRQLRGEPAAAAAGAAASDFSPCVTSVGRVKVPSFNRIRYRRHDARVFLYAFDLIELNGDDLRHDPLEVRRGMLANILARSGDGIRLNDHIEDDGPTVFKHACKLGLEGIVSKRRHSPYRSGRSPDWLKMKNPNAPAVKREEEEDWGRR